MDMEFAGNGGLGVSLDDGNTTFALERSEKVPRAWMVNRGEVVGVAEVPRFASGATINIHIGEGSASAEVDGETIIEGDVSVADGNVFVCRPRSELGDLNLRITRIELTR